MATKAASGEPSMKLQIVVDKEKNRVVYAEAKKDFVDFIFHILSLPLGVVHRILANNTSTILGSLGTLQEGLKNLDDEYLEKPTKDYLLDRLKAPFWGKNTTLLLPEASLDKTRHFYQCSKELKIVSVEKRCCLHLRSCSMNKINLKGSELGLAVVLGNEYGYVKDWRFMVMDDLVVRPLELNSFLSLLCKQSNWDVIEKREVIFGNAEAIKLLKASISSKTVLTDVFLHGAVKMEN